MISKYKTFKNTSYKNLVSIPSQWAVIRLKYLVSCNDDVITVHENDDFEINYIEIGDVNIEKGVKQFSTIKINEAASRARRIVRTNDIIISTVRTYLKGIAKIPSEFNGFIASTGFAVLRARKIDPNFLHYVVQNETFIEEIISMSVGASYPAITSSNLLSIQVPFPSSLEQTKIAQYLDHQTAIIDQIILQKEKMIELLKEKRQAVINEALTKGLDPNAKMKDSGIEWLGEVPEHWAFKALKYLTVKEKGIQTGPFGTQLSTKDYVDVGIKVLNQKTLIDEDYLSGVEFISQSKFDELATFEVKSGDMIMGTRGSFGTKNRTTFGKCSIVPEGLSSAVLHPCLIRIRLDENLISKYYFKYYVNDSTFFLEEIFNTSNSTTIEVIYGTSLKSIKFPVPPLYEQIQILEYLDKRICESDEFIKLETLQIEKLKEYRQSIISEAVTGKIDVRDWQPNKQQNN